MSWWRALLLGMLAAVPWYWWAWRRLRRAVHILQLEEYENARALRWARRYWLADEAPIALGIATVLFALAVLLVLTNAGGTGSGHTAGILWASALWTGIAGISGVRSMLTKRQAPKKPLAVTTRVKRLFGALVLTLVLLAVIALLAGWGLGAPGRDAFLVVPLIAWLGVAAGPLPVALANVLALPVESANRRRYRNGAIARLRTVTPRIIAITGSYGKTTTKELTAAVLETRYPGRVLKTPASFNTVMGITRVIREQLEDEHEVFVVEMGAYQRGDIRDLCRFVGGPDVSAIVGINEQHLERMGSIENTIRAKYEIVEGTKPGGVSIFNVDNAYCERLANQTTHVCVMRVGTGEHDPPSDLWADNVAVNPKLMRFDVHDGEQTLTVRTRLLGRHLVPNFLIALAIGKAMEVDLRQAVSRLGRVEPVRHRLAVSETDGMIVIDDAYSSNVDGARAALGLLAELPAQRRFVVTPGIVELGPVEAERNRELGASAAAVCDALLVVGSLPGRYVREGAESAGFAADHVIACPNLAAAQAYLRDHMRSGDAVLFENDLPDNYA